MSEGSKPQKAKKKKSKAAKSAVNLNSGNGPAGNLEDANDVPASGCCVTVTEIRKQVDAAGENVETKGKVYTLSSLPEAVLASGCGNSVSADSSKSPEVDLNSLREITVIRTDANPPGSRSAGSASDTHADISEAAKTSKKKKKKKKKKKSSCSEENAEPPSNGDKTSEKNTCTQPTYVKLPSTGDACVLIVSHENFSTSDSQKNKTDAAFPSANLPDLSAGSDPSRGNPDLKLAYLDQNDDGSVIDSNHQHVASNTTSAESVAPVREKLPGIQNDKSSKGTSEISERQVSGFGSESAEQPSSSKSNVVKVQRPGKTAKKVTESSETSKSPSKGPGVMNRNVDASSTAKTKASAKKGGQHQDSNSVNLFSHLPPYKSLSVLRKHLEISAEMHPTIATVGVQAAEGIICGSDARCISILGALDEVFRDYQTPANKELSRDLDAKCQSYVSSVGKFRPLSVSMINAIKFLKLHITNMTESISDSEAKQQLHSLIKKFVREEICLAKQAIVACASSKVVDGDVILTHAYSTVVKDVLCEAFSQGKRFRVVVVDSKPKMEGREMLRCLLKCGIRCSYTLISGISFIMKEVSKVFIGAHSLLANGYVMSRVGSSQIALIAAAYNIPVLVCCETYKFCERVHTDSFDCNELGSSVSFNPERWENDANEEKTSSLSLLNVLYDITPPYLVSVVVTEKGVLPCTSVPVVLRVRHSGSHE